MMKNPTEALFFWTLIHLNTYVLNWIGDGKLVHFLWIVVD
jgi:hypothetical protein